MDYLVSGSLFLAPQTPGRADRSVIGYADLYFLDERAILLAEAVISTM